MIWRLMSLFGCRYVLLESNCDADYKICRVRRRPDGVLMAAFFSYCARIGMVKLLPEGKCDGASYVGKWVQLTGKPLF